MPSRSARSAASVAKSTASWFRPTGEFSVAAPTSRPASIKLPTAPPSVPSPATTTGSTAWRSTRRRKSWRLEAGTVKSTSGTPTMPKALSRSRPPPAILRPPPPPPQNRSPPLARGCRGVGSRADTSLNWIGHTQPSLFPRQMFRRRGAVDQQQSVFDQDFAGHFPQRSPRNVVVARKALEIDPGQDVTERVVRQPEQQVVLAAHFSLQVEADIRQGLAGNRQDLGIADVHQIQPCLHGLVGIERILERRPDDDRLHQR